MYYLHLTEKSEIKNLCMSAALEYNINYSLNKKISVSDMWERKTRNSTLPMDPRKDKLLSLDTNWFLEYPLPYWELGGK